jgi:hypothetical protein
MSYTQNLFRCLILGTLFFSQPGCFFYSGVSTINKTTSAQGSGFLAATERNGHWDMYGPPPRVGEVTDRPLYRKLQNEAVYSILGPSQGYELSDPYLPRRYRIVAIREVGTTTESGSTLHYYEVEFDPEGGA